MVNGLERAESVERVVHVRRDPYDVYVGRGRGSKWGNPVRIGDPHPKTGQPIKRGEAIPLFKNYVVRGAGRHLLKDLGELEGQTLGCFCAPEGGVGAHDPLVCHGQILLLLLEWRRRKIAEKRGQTYQSFRIELRHYHSPDDLGRGRYNTELLGDPYPSKAEAEADIAILEPKLQDAGAIAVMVAVPEQTAQR